MTEAAIRIHPQSVRPVWRSWMPTATTLAPVMAQMPSETGIAIRASRRAISAARIAATVVAATVAARLTPHPGGNLTAGEVPVHAGRERIAADGLPVGIQIAGPYLRDRTVTAFAQTLASLIGGFAPPPAYAAATT
jgi:Asp-tRNA(Asn)/Glu-tRNA(Gln) amidotransferase A subunit family amidase